MLSTEYSVLSTVFDLPDGAFIPFGGGDVMAGVRVFTDLIFWKRSREWSKRIFHLTKHEPFHSDRRLVEQTNDSSESVMSNIAVGFGRGTQGELITFLGY